MVGRDLFHLGEGTPYFCGWYRKAELTTSRPFAFCPLIRPDHSLPFRYSPNDRQSSADTRGDCGDGGVWTFAKKRGIFMQLLLPALALIALTFVVEVDVSAQSTKPQPSPTDWIHTVSLKCSPRKLWLGDTLTLNMSVPHGRDLAVVSPDGKFFLLRSWEPNNPEAIVQWYDFEKVKQLKLGTSNATGSVGTGDEIIFSKTGWYKILISYNLETDDGTPFNECKVYYVHRRR
jgi:hypothetical protein